MPESQDVVDRLIAIHGEAGLCPTRGDWMAILGCPAGRPVDLLNRANGVEVSRVLVMSAQRS